MVARHKVLGCLIHPKTVDSSTSMNGESTTFTAASNIKLVHSLTVLRLCNHPDFSSLIRAHEEPSTFVKGETCRSETILFPNIWPYLPALFDVLITHDIDDCSLAIRASRWLSVPKINFRYFESHGGFTVPEKTTVSPHA